ncbi:MAG TPA: phosphoribosylanthranilate isomerase [Steroidobacteraceae bacterium]|nr:phosphoribosylanthranilate isomerase [Steroidobacteraceae bacterium]
MNTRGFVKICGITDQRAVEAALAAGADAIGFVFAPSVRRMQPEEAAELARPARNRALCVAVTQHPDARLLQQIFTQFQPDVLQTDVEDLRGMNVPAGVATWPVLRSAHAFSAAGEGDGAAQALPVLRAGQRMVFEGPRSGVGKPADWNAARNVARDHALILAGGLDPANVATAIDAVHPFGVDVSSGVEEAPGRKSPALIASFLIAARKAFASLHGEH